MSRFRNFDKFSEEASGESLTVRVMGKKWELPPDAPAAEIAHLQRVRSVVVEMREERGELNETDELTEEEEKQIREVLRFDPKAMLSNCIGAETVDAWFELGITHKHFQHVFWSIMADYESGGISESDEEEEPEGEEPAPTKGAKTSSGSSKTGRSSKRTSSANTGST